MKIKENLFLRYNPDFQNHHYTSEELIFKVNNMRRTSYMLRRYRIKATIHNIFHEDLNWGANDEKRRSGVWISRSIKWFQILNALHDDIAGSITTATTTTTKPKVQKLGNDSNDASNNKRSTFWKYTKTKRQLAEVSHSTLPIIKKYLTPRTCLH